MMKILWVLRGLIYSPFFGQFGCPSYIGKPLFINLPGSRIEVFGRISSVVFEDNILISRKKQICMVGL
jgi:hypothetical protein